MLSLRTTILLAVSSAVPLGAAMAAQPSRNRIVRVVTVRACNSVDLVGSLRTIGNAWRPHDYCLTSNAGTGVEGDPS